MKAFLALVLSLGLLQTAFADDSAHLKIKIKGQLADNKYFFCTTEAGCLSMYAGQKGQVYPINPGKIGHVFTTNISNLRLYMQDAPASCKVEVKENQTVTVTGKLVVKSQDNVQIENLKCSVA